MAVFIILYDKIYYYTYLLFAAADHKVNFT